MTKVFVDTNVLIYGRDAAEPEKQARATAWLSALDRRRVGRLNLQVINEFTRWSLVKRRDRSVSEIRAEADLLRAWGDDPLGREEVDFAWSVRELFGFQWFDCLLVGSAAASKCSFFLTEDMVHGTRFEGVTIISPFEVAPQEL